MKNLRSLTNNHDIQYIHIKNYNYYVTTFLYYCKVNTVQTISKTTCTYYKIYFLNQS